jgi:hypothetical protein
MTKHTSNFAISMMGALVLVSASAVAANAMIVPSQINIQGSKSQLFEQRIIQTASSSEIRQSQRDARNKYNPNAALIGQMLGGAKSLDIGGLGRPDVSPRHYAYCVRKYGSYRFEDNTYIQFSGTRTQCVSPFYAGDEAAR